ncbi:hypothetical protein BOTBODRAFT_64908 [Botryobasidium botryosum FD-172 SS1]|uniref:Uncharacterized protein n=1 Tax=Botryobasidium botryosum (strain FD-172 SS1) TaxID=930990 RepID=A0A067MKK0_BOTB1|nr:hypothetical protein BOTBODRAFT_64908 [Botryobasidium botryosum FD-172 SS1]
MLQAPPVRWHALRLKVERTAFRPTATTPTNVTAVISFWVSRSARAPWQAAVLALTLPDSHRVCRSARLYHICQCGVLAGFSGWPHRFDSTPPYGPDSPSRNELKQCSI